MSSVFVSSGQQSWRAIFIFWARGTQKAIRGSMFEPDEDLQQIRRDLDEFIELLRENKKSLGQKGMDVSGVVADLEAKYAAVLNAAEEADALQEQYLHACADAADAEVEYFKEVCTMMRPMEEEDPKDPEVRQWLEIKDAWQKELPREELEED